MSSPILARDRASLRALQDRHAIDEGVAPRIAALLVASTAAALLAWQHGQLALAALAILVVALLDNSALAMLHESVHGLLSRSRWRNEAIGLAVGFLALTPPTVYRYVHARHHAHLGGPRDPEFWPYNLPGCPRWIRVAFAWTELLAGWIFTPFLYSIRCAQDWRRMPAAMRRRLALEWSALVLVWSGVLLSVAAAGAWEAWVVAYLLPAWIAGSAQTVRKFTEHLGMHGTTIAAMTRCVRYRGALGRAFSLSQLHVEHHATHHRCPRIPWRALPEATEIVCRGARFFPDHLRAARDALRHLLDPKLGPQWHHD